MWKKLNTQKQKYQQKQHILTNIPPSNNQLYYDKLHKIRNFHEQSDNSDNKYKINLINKFAINDIDDIFCNVHDNNQDVIQNISILQRKNSQSNNDEDMNQQDNHKMKQKNGEKSIKKSGILNNSVTNKKIDAIAKQSNYYADNSQDISILGKLQNHHCGQKYAKSQLFYQDQFSAYKKNKEQQKNRKELNKNYNEQPLILYSETSHEQIKFKKTIQQTVEQKMQMDDFFDKIKQAGVDILDQQSDNSRDISSIIANQDPQNNFLQAQTPKQKNYSSLMKSQKHKQTKTYDSTNKKQSLQSIGDLLAKSKNQIIPTKKFKKKNNIKMRLQNNLKQISSFNENLFYLNSYILESKRAFNLLYENLEAELVKKIRYDQQKQQNNIKQKTVINQQRNTIDLLKLKQLSLEGQIIQNKVQITKLNQIIKQLNYKNEELCQNIFQSEQKVVQGELQYQKKLQQFIQNYTAGKAKQKQNKLSQNCTQLQIRRLTTQVEGLTILYQQTLQQHKNAIQNQKLKYTLQIQKLARKQTILQKRQQKLQQNQQKIKQLQEKLNHDNIQLERKQQQLNQIQQMLQQKFIKIQQLQRQLNEGFTYLSQIKSQNKQNMQKIQKTNRQLLMKNQKLQKQIQNFKDRLYQNYKQRQKQKEKEKDKEKDKFRQMMDLGSMKYRSLTASQDRQILSQYYNKYSREYFPEQEYKQQRTERFGDSIQLQKGQKNLSKQKIYSQQYNKLLHKSNSGNAKAYYTEQNQKPLNKTNEKNSNYFPDQKNYNKFTTTHNSKYMSQVSNCTPYFSPKNSKPSLMDWKPVRQKVDSPSFSSLQRKWSPSAKRPVNYKLNQLDSKMQTLRYEIKKQIKSVKTKNN